MDEAVGLKGSKAQQMGGRDWQRWRGCSCIPVGFASARILFAVPETSAAAPHTLPGLLDVRIALILHDSFSKTSRATDCA